MKYKGVYGMKKTSMLLAFVFAFTFIFASFSLVVSAEEKTEKTYSSLEELAKDYIVKVTRIDKDGVTTVTARNIPRFTEAAHRYFPDLDDIVIARFVYKYSGKHETPETLPDESVLQILTSEEVCVQEEILSPSDGKKDKEKTDKNITEENNSSVLKIVFSVAAGVLVVAGAVVVVMKRKKDK